MRIIYKTFSGHRVVKEFSSWPEMCLWLKRFYPLVNFTSQLGELARL